MAIAFIIAIGFAPAVPSRFGQMPMLEFPLAAATSILAPFFRAILSLRLSWFFLWLSVTPSVSLMEISSLRVPVRSSSGKSGKKPPALRAWKRVEAGFANRAATARCMRGSPRRPSVEKLDCLRLPVLFGRLLVELEEGWSSAPAVLLASSLFQILGASSLFISASFSSFSRAPSISSCFLVSTATAILSVWIGMNAKR